MDRLVLVGNGFDIGHKFKTSYSDFMDFLKNSVVKIKTNNPINEKPFVTGELGISNDKTQTLFI